MAIQIFYFQLFSYRLQILLILTSLTKFPLINKSPHLIKLKYHFFINGNTYLKQYFIIKGAGDKSITLRFQMVTKLIS